MRRVKPGWYVLGAVTVYAVVVSILLFSRTAAPASAATAETASPPSPGATVRGAATASGPAGLWFPIPGARLPGSDANLPGAPRPYRSGVSQGFDFVDGDLDVPVPYGAAVIASAAGQVIRADVGYVELSRDRWEALLDDVADGTTEEELDELRGRQVWIQTEDGTVLRYGHLSRVASGVSVGRTVYRGQVVGYVGNSGTDAGVAGGRDRPRLRFEVWPSEGEYFGQGLTAEQVRLEAASLFVGP